MKKRSSLAAAASIGLAITALAAAPAATAGTPPTPVVVTSLGSAPTSLTWSGWDLGGDATGTQVTALDPQPDATYDDGSLHLATPASGDKAQVAYSLVENGEMTSLSSVTSMGYSTYVSSSATNPAAPAYQFSSYCSGGQSPSGFTTFVFEPVYNAAAQGAVTPGAWQHWDAFDSGNAVWWSTHTVTGTGGTITADTDYVSWSTILKDCPTAATYQLLITVGSGVPGADTHADGVELNGTTWDFAMPGKASFSFDNFPTTLVTGAAPSDFSGTLVNPANGPDYQQLRYDITVSGISGLRASQVTLEYQLDGTWQPVPLTDQQNGTITGYFGPQNGFPFPAGQSSTTPLRLAIAAGAPTGTAHVVTDLDYVGVDPWTITSVTSTIAVAAPAASTSASSTASAEPTNVTGSPTTSTAPLAATGTPAAPLTWLGLVLLAGGTGVLLFARRRFGRSRAH